jgi:hypothetical protein
VYVCRNCGSQNLRDLGFTGEVAPFFLKRVLNMEIGNSVARHPLRILARRICDLPQRFLSKVYGAGVFVEMQICRDCSFVQTRHAFRDEDLGRLYADYRTASYNEERIRYEPTYASLAKYVGVGNQEVECRVGGLTEWLADKIHPGEGFSMLDFGGSDGRFLPRIEGKKLVYEISNTLPLPGIERIADEADLKTYSYVQIAHVLEHVPEPLSLLKRVANLVEPSGYLYIEVPQDLTDAEIDGLKSGRLKRGLTVHEHINVYCPTSIRRLVEASGLVPACVESTRIDLGWITGTNVRALCQKVALHGHM